MWWQFNPCLHCTSRYSHLQIAALNFVELHRTFSTVFLLVGWFTEADSCLLREKNFNPRSFSSPHIGYTTCNHCWTYCTIVLIQLHYHMIVFTWFINTKQKVAWRFVFMLHHLEIVLLPVPQSENAISGGRRNETNQVLRWDWMLSSLVSKDTLWIWLSQHCSYSICNAAGETSIVLNYYGLLEWPWNRKTKLQYLFGTCRPRISQLKPFTWCE